MTDDKSPSTFPTGSMGASLESVCSASEAFVDVLISLAWPSEILFQIAAVLLGVKVDFLALLESPLHFVGEEANGVQTHTIASCGGTLISVRHR